MNQPIRTRARTLIGPEPSSVVASKEGENAFLEYVAHGPTKKMLSQILDFKCPSQTQDKAHVRSQWIWEREDRETEPGKPQPWEQTMYWDCLFVARLYKSGPIDRYNLPELPGYADISKEAERQLQATIDGIKTLLASLDQLRLKLMDPLHPPTMAEIVDLLKGTAVAVSQMLPGPAAQLTKGLTEAIPPPPPSPIQSFCVANPNNEACKAKSIVCPFC
jgi:hypothetical protein